MLNSLKFLTIAGSGAVRHCGKQDAVERLAAMLAKLEAVRVRMRKVNTLVRNRDAKGLKRLGYADSEVTRMLQPDSENRCAFFTDFKLRNNYRRIVALRRMARSLDSAASDEVTLDDEAFSYHEDPAAESIAFRFTDKPDKATRAHLRRAGFVLRPSRNTYERRLDAAGIAAAAQLRAQLGQRTH